MNPLASLSGGFSSSIASKSGDASGKLDSTQPFQYNASFQVGGSGKQTQDQGASQSTSPGGVSNTLIYVALGVGALAILGVGIALIRK